jgi:hypothetical protein
VLDAVNRRNPHIWRDSGFSSLSASERPRALENAGRLVAKDELIRAVWPNVIATDESLTRCISEVRFALQDHA